MKKTKCIFIAFTFLSLLFVLTGCSNDNFNNENMSSNNQNYNAEKTASNTETSKNVTNNISISETEPIETEISSFSTPIQIDDNNRDANMEITAKKINGTIVKQGEEFSFNQVVGSPTEEKGYEKAGVFVNGKKVKGYGGGNCQVSTTIYNAVLGVKNLEVTERHEHGKEVGYVKKGKDATVAYDSLDLKFKNNTKNDIKLLVTVDEKNVTARILKVE